MFGGLVIASSTKGYLFLLVALVVALNHFLFSVAPDAARPVFHWIDPFVVLGLAFVFVRNLGDAVRAVPVGALTIFTPTTISPR